LIQGLLSGIIPGSKPIYLSKKLAAFFADGGDFFKLNGLSRLEFRFFDINDTFGGGDLVLLAAGFDDSIHFYILLIYKKCSMLSDRIAGEDFFVFNHSNDCVDLHSF